MKARGYLAAELDRATARRSGLTIDARLLEGSEVAELRKLSESAQLLVVGESGRRARPRFSSVSRRLVARAGCPVAVVRGDNTE